MPIPAALIAAGGSALQSGSQVLGTILQNRSNQQLAQDQRNWNEQQWLREQAAQNRNWNIQNRFNIAAWRAQNKYNESRWEAQNKHNIDMWNMQNQYNSPIEQMARLEQAGINPHMVYNNGATHTASSIPSSSQAVGSIQKAGLGTPNVKGYNRAQVDSITRGINAFSDYQRLKNLQAQTDNVEAQTEVAQQQKLNLEQEALYKAAATLGKNYENQVAKQTLESQVEAFKLGVEEKQLANKYARNTMQSRIDQAQVNVNLALENTKGRKLENELRQELNQLKRYGVTDADNIIIRMILQGATEAGVDPISIIKNMFQ